MHNPAQGEIDVAAVDHALKDQIDRDDASMGTVAPVLGHLVLNAENSLFSDQIVAQVRGMAAHVAKQFLQTSGPDRTIGSPDGQDVLADAFLRCDAFITHCHVLAIEGDLSNKLSDRSGIDAVLTPMLQALIASDDDEMQRLAMAILSAQARFIQHYRRMELPIAELPGAVFELLLFILKDFGESMVDVSTIETLRAHYNDSQNRLVLIDRLLSKMGKGALAALSLPHAGVALFLSTLAQLAPVDRTLAVYSTNERQIARLSLAMRAAGMKFAAMQEQMALFQPDCSVSPAMEHMRIEQAKTLIETSCAVWGDRS
ncbi:MAG: hypothetical protein WA948_02560 [Pontixanthobacter sp.]